MHHSRQNLIGMALDRLDRRLEREILRLRARYQLSLDEFRGLYISDEQVDRLLATPPPAEITGKPDAPTLTEGLGDDPRWAHVTATFGLAPIERDLLLIAVAPELDLKYETLYAYLNDDVTRKWPTAELAARLIGPPGTARPAVIDALGAGASLRASRLIASIDPPAARPSLLNAGFAAHPAVVRFLQGLPVTSRGDAAPPRDDPFAGLALDAPQMTRLRGLSRLLAARGPDAPVVIIAGPPGSGRMSAARALAASAGLRAQVLDFRAARRAAVAPATAVADATLELGLEPGALCATGLEALNDHDGRLQPEALGVFADVGRPGVPLILTAPPLANWPDLIGGRRAHVVELGVPEYGGRLALWRRHLGEAGLDLTDEEACALADRFAFTPAQISAAVATAAEWVAMGEAERADGALVRDAARAQPRERLGALAVMVTARHGWTDLVLPPAVHSRLREIASAIRLRHVVYSDWAFARRLSGGTGVKALFAGASGTGKTMAAGVIALELGLDLVKVDLSAVVSKYIGETEKNLEQVFAGARAGNSLLFFDEADALFGKRSDVKDAHDRYANVEVAYLLQKLEAHDGVVILATNLRRNIDDAFSRRMHYVVDFPQPDVADRERLWRGMFPPEAPLGTDVDFAFLAKQFELAGGDIRNVVLDAAFLAASEHGAIGMRHLVRGLARHQAKQGRTPSMAEFQRYYELVG